MTPEDVLRVLVVDDHAVFAEALALAIDTTVQLSCIGTAVDLERALVLADKESPDVAVMDVTLGHDDGITGTRLLRERHPEIRVLILTGQRPSLSLMLAAADAGASAFLEKATSLGVVVDMIPALRAHTFAVDRAMFLSACGAQADQGATPGRRAGGLLTGREYQILDLLARGIDVQTAAKRLGITVNTYRGYMKDLYNKLGVHSQIEALAVARRRGLLEDAPPDHPPD